MFRLKYIAYYNKIYKLKIKFNLIYWFSDLKLKYKYIGRCK